MNEFLLGSETEIKIRKYQHALITNSYGLIIFGVWSIIKCAMYIYFRTGPVDEAFNQFDDQILQIILLVFIAVLLGIDLLWRWIIVRSAIAEGKGKKAGNVYLVFAFIMSILSIGGLITGIINVVTDTNDYYRSADFIVSMFVEATSLSAMLGLSINALRLRKIRRAQEQK